MALTIPSVEERLPLRPKDMVVTAPLPELSDAKKAAREATAKRMEEFVAARDRVRAERVLEIDAWEAGNATQARAIRAQFDGRA